MTDAQLMHLASKMGMQPDPSLLKNTGAILEAYKMGVKALNPYSTTIDGITDPRFVEAVDKVLKAERAHPQMYTAYHGCAAEIHFLNTVYAVIAKKLGLDHRTIHWRLFDNAYKRYATVKAAFADAAQSSNQHLQFVNSFELLVAGNAALTGNPGHDGCRTLTYWKNSHSEVRFDLKHMLYDVFLGLGLSQEISQNFSEQFYDLFKALYYVDDSSISGLEDTKESKQKRPVGVLRQIFINPALAENQLSLSGWSFNQPIHFADRTLPDGSVVSIYDGLEEGDKKWMRDLPSVARFMAHIRAGDSIAMEQNIAAYQKRVPDGQRPFGLLDYEVRLATAENPEIVKTHYFPPSANDEAREETVERQADQILNLQGVELPIRSFYDFSRSHKILQYIIRNQLGINVDVPPVSLDEFKVAVAQGDRETMAIFLSDPRFSGVTIKQRDIILNEIREFTIPDFMAMVGVRHNMAVNTILAVTRKYLADNLENVLDFVTTPYALRILLALEGLNGLEKLGWNGDIDKTESKYTNSKKLAINKG